MKVACPQFKNGEKIPAKFTCDNENTNPTFVLENIPQNASSLVITMLDVDSKAGLWIHWVQYDIPVLSRIEKNFSKGEKGINDFGSLGYGGPCPGQGIHRYVFHFYALDKMLGLESGRTLQEVENAMSGHIINSGDYMGLYDHA